MNKTQFENLVYDQWYEGGITTDKLKSKLKNKTIDNILVKKFLKNVESDLYQYNTRSVLNVEEIGELYEIFGKQREMPKEEFNYYMEVWWEHTEYEGFNTQNLGNWLRGQKLPKEATKRVLKEAEEFEFEGQVVPPKTLGELRDIFKLEKNITTFDSLKSKEKRSINSITDKLVKEKTKKFHKVYNNIKKESSKALAEFRKIRDNPNSTKKQIKEASDINIKLGRQLEILENLEITFHKATAKLTKREIRGNITRKKIALRLKGRDSYNPNVVTSYDFLNEIFGVLQTPKKKDTRKSLEDIIIEKAYKPTSQLSDRGLKSGLRSVKNEDRKADLRRELKRRLKKKKITRGQTSKKIKAKLIKVRAKEKNKRMKKSKEIFNRFQQRYTDIEQQPKFIIGHPLQDATTGFQIQKQAGIELQHKDLKQLKKLYISFFRTKDRAINQKRIKDFTVDKQEIKIRGRIFKIESVSFTMKDNKGNPARTGALILGHHKDVKVVDLDVFVDELYNQKPPKGVQVIKYQNLGARDFSPEKTKGSKFFSLEKLDIFGGDSIKTPSAQIRKIVQASGRDYGGTERMTIADDVLLEGSFEKNGFLFKVVGGLRPHTTINIVNKRKIKSTRREPIALVTIQKIKTTKKTLDKIISKAFPNPRWWQSLSYKEQRAYKIKHKKSKLQITQKPKIKKVVKSKLKLAKNKFKLDKWVASGLGREVFDIGDNKVVKIARDSGGLLQNKVDATLIVGVTLPVLEKGDDYVVQLKVKTLTEKIKNFSVDLNHNILYNPQLMGKGWNKNNKELKRKLGKIGGKYGIALEKLINYNNNGDMTSDNIGELPNGDLRIIDNGFLLTSEQLLGSGTSAKVRAKWRKIKEQRSK